MVRLLDRRGTAPAGAGAGAHHLGLTSRSQLSDIARRRAELDLVKLLTEARRVLAAGGDDPVALAHQLHRIGSEAVVVATRAGLRPSEVEAA